MKKIKQICSAILIAHTASADPSAYDVRALAGVVYPDSRTHLENQAVVGAAVQYNGFEWPLNPELSLLQSLETDYNAYDGTPALYQKVYGYGSTFITRVMFNGVHTYEMQRVSPFVKLGLGYEEVGRYDSFDNTSAGIADAGAGLMFRINDAFSGRFEALGMYKFNERNDFNFGLTIGLTYHFGKVPSTIAAEEAAAKAAEEEAAAVRAEAQRKALEQKVAEEKAAMEAIKRQREEAAAAAAMLAAATKDTDGDGVPDSVDHCKETPEDASVDDDGCPVTPQTAGSTEE